MYLVRVTVTLQETDTNNLDTEQQFVNHTNPCCYTQVKQSCIAVSFSSIFQMYIIAFTRRISILKATSWLYVVLV